MGILKNYLSIIFPKNPWFFGAGDFFCQTKDTLDLRMNSMLVERGFGGF